MRRRNERVIILNSILGKGKTFSQYAALYSIIAAIGAFLFGYDTAVISGVIGFIRD
jgi:hypothetical protein